MEIVGSTIKQEINDELVLRIQKDFPILSREFLDKNRREKRKLIYFDNAATSQKPLPVINAIKNFYEKQNSNVHRAIHTLGEEATALYEESRRKVQRFINAKSTCEIVFTRGTTEAINLVAASWGREHIGSGDEILLTEMEHHSNLIPWQLLAKARGCTLRFVPFRKDGTLSLQSLDQLWSDRIKLVSVVHVSNVFGTINNVRKIIELAHAHDVPVLIDAAQSVPHMPVDVQELDCDFLAFSGHKMCGPMGIGVLYGKEKLLESMPPYMGGGEMIMAVWLERATWNDLPHKFEAGSPNVAGAIGLGAAIDYLSGLGMSNIMKYEKSLTDHALACLANNSRLTLYGSAPDRSGVVSFNVKDTHAHDVAQFLDMEGIALRAGHHCAQPIMRKLGIPACVRASFSFYNTRSEVDHLVRALNKTEDFFSYGL